MSRPYRLRHDHRWTISSWAARAFLAFCLAFPVTDRAEQPGNVLLEANEQLFCVLATVNAAGYDAGLGIDTGDDTRTAVRSYLARQETPILPELRRFYATHETTSGSGASLSQYVSLSLLIGPPPDFRLTVPQTDLPPDVRRVDGLIPLLKSFYNQADLLGLWARVQPRYQALIDRSSEAVRRSVSVSDAYLRFPSGSYLGRTCTIYLDLLAAPEQVQARIYGPNYYVVVTPSKQPKIDEIRHQYLHFLLDPLAVKYAAEIEQKRSLARLAHSAPSLARDFKEDYSLLVTECLIRAVELRIDKRPKAEATKDLDDDLASGLILAPYFYSALADYEQQDSSMTVYYKQMILGIDAHEVAKSLTSVKFKPAPTPSAPQADQALSEEDRLLNQADNLVYERRLNEARSVYQMVLEKVDAQSERALFGMAVIASNTRKPDIAEEYFKKTLEAARDLRLVTWSHIYLGRIYDLEGKRDAALSQYRAASLTAATYPEAFRAVESGLLRPFGSKDD